MTWRFKSPGHQQVLHWLMMWSDVLFILTDRYLLLKSSQPSVAYYMHPEKQLSFPQWHIYASHISLFLLTHWGWATYICVGKLTIIGSDNGLSPGRRQAIIWTIAGILLIGPLGTNFSEILIGIQTFSFKKMNLKMSSAKWRPFVSASMS